jgi:hypothetical protein
MSAWFAAIAATSAVLLVPSPTRKAPMKLTYGFKVDKSLRYRFTADIKGKLPLFDNPEPIAADATLKLLYVAKPKAVLDDGQADVELVVEEAEMELSKIPLPIGVEQVQDFLNQTVTLAKTGKVLKIAGGTQTPFSVSIPGIEPKRLYALMFPFVFPDKEVQAGDKWEFKGELVSEQGAKANFTATVLPQADASVATIPIKQEFTLPVSQSLNEKKQQIEKGQKAYFSRAGSISGSGVFQFDPAKGQFVSGEMTLKANITQTRLAKLPKKPVEPGLPAPAEDPLKVVTTVQAKVNIKLEDN